MTIVLQWGRSDGAAEGYEGGHRVNVITLLDRRVPRGSTLRGDRRPGNRAASASRSPFRIECQGTDRSFNAPPHLQDSVGIYMNGQ